MYDHGDNSLLVECPFVDQLHFYYNLSYFSSNPSRQTKNIKIIQDIYLHMMESWMQY